MAPEDILRNIDEGRREFIRKALAGTTFAVPLMASFSMEGLSVNPAEAVVSNATCADTGPGSPCCELAQEIAVVISLVICLTGVVGHEINASPQIKAKLFRPLAAALEQMSRGISAGGEGCNNSTAQNRFEKAREDMLDYLKTLAQVCGATSDVYLELNEGVPWFFEAFDALIRGKCEYGFAALENLRPVQLQLQQQFGQQP